MGNDSASGIKKSNGLNFKHPTWVNIGAVILFFAAISGWLINYGGQRAQVSHMKDRLSILEARLKEVELWQRDWPSKGELILDRAQNTTLDELLRRVNKLEGK